MSLLSIRPAVVDDSSTILKFITELAIYEKAEHEVLANEQTIKETIFAPSGHVNALICESNGTPIGMAIYFFNYSTWLAKPGLYLEDLYVTEAQRGQGAGKLLLKRLAQIALEQGCGRFEWSCLDWNTPARDFYHSIGAVAQTQWIGYRMAGNTLHQFAKDD
ncbi:GNAT family N-acetyltransferase [Pseudoalteromonas tunicata]|uniref:GNAT family N-acetyltransferase n=1 Tax=Pseudoalteromonas tunicata TaxID=314281 RepID=UPI00273D43BE|nr:GNAT family N-acetyltransferase [Pseudoalteromonas tunicata]MDP4984731.1 GNAT family N-acetyltransferase [Pseudoalteromonas tunicata]